MVPAVLVYFNVFNETMLNATTALMKEANFLYFVISMLVVGSMLGMHGGRCSGRRSRSSRRW
jgi:malate:Na+ symporter